MGTDLLSDIGREIDARLREMQPLVEEYEELLGALAALSLDGAGPVSSDGHGSEARSDGHRRAPRSGGRPVKRRAPASKRAIARGKRPADSRTSVRDQAGEAILGALEHGSHTVAELAVVTAMAPAAINRSVRALVDAGLVCKTEREGKAAWALAAAG